MRRWISTPLPPASHHTAPTYTAVTTGSATSSWHFGFPTTSLVDAYLLLVVYSIQPTFDGVCCGMRFAVETNAITRGRPRKDARLHCRSERRVMHRSNYHSAEHTNGKCTVDKVSALHAAQGLNDGVLDVLCAGLERRGRDGRRGVER